VIERVEQAGGEIYAIDHGRLTNGTAATRMSNNMMGAAFQYYAEVTGEKVAVAQERVVAHGVLPNSRISPGYVRGEDGVRSWSAPRPGSSGRGQRRGRDTLRVAACARWELDSVRILSSAPGFAEGGAPPWVAVQVIARHDISSGILPSPP